MEKEPQPDSLSNVTVKEYASSEVYVSEPPPAYRREGQAPAVQVARIAAVTIICVSFIMGTFMLASAYIQANASCTHLQQELMLLQETVERVQEPQALMQDEQSAQESKAAYAAEAKQAKEEEESDNNIDDSEEPNPEPIRIKLPLQLDFDELAGALIEKNQKSRMNCVVEKKRADQIIDHQPKSIPLPFGVNLTTDPRYEHVTGEKMAIYCESGNGKDEPERAEPKPTHEEVMMHIQPIIIPMQDMPQHYHQQQQQQQPMTPMHPMQPMHQMHQMQGVQSAQPMHRPMVPPQIIAQHIAQIQRMAAIQAQQHQQQQMPPQYSRNRFPIPEEILTQINRLPHTDDVIAIQVSEESDEPESRENRVEARQFPQPIPIHQEPPQQDPNAPPPRPHYVHPRSVRSVDALLPREKRVKRCACDCAC